MSTLIDDVFYSPSIRKDIAYRALVPDTVPGTAGEPRVVYLLHGLFGSHKNWSELTDLPRYVGAANLLVVMPDGGDNWYTDSDEKYESYLIQDMLPAIEAKYGVDPERRNRVIAGNSMGGYGALKLAFRYPGKFETAASFSGAFHAARMPTTCGSELDPSIRRVFGDAGSAIRRGNDLFVLAAAAAGRGDALPEIYFDCGADDEFISANRELSSTLVSLGIKHDFLEVDGAHDWPYWDKRIEHFLSFLRSKNRGEDP